MLTLLLFALASIAFAQGPPTTTVTVQLYSTFGAASSGTIVITNEAFTIGTFTIPKQSQTILVPSSGLTVPLVQTVGSVPPTIYRVQTTVTGVMSVTYWNIPAGGPVAIKDVLTIPTVGASVLLTQLSPATYSDNAVRGNGADTSEDTLSSYTLPSGGMTTGKYWRVYASFTTIPGSTARVYLGMTSICQWSSAPSDTFILDIRIAGRGTNSQVAVCNITDGSFDEVSVMKTLSTEDSTTALPIKTTGQSSNGAAGDITQQILTIEPGN